jgi:hypothetical protein
VPDENKNGSEKMKCKKHEPFINPMQSGKPAEMIDDKGLLGKKGERYYECYLCGAYYSPKTGKQATWIKTGKKAKGKSQGMWFM